MVKYFYQPIKIPAAPAKKATKILTNFTAMKPFGDSAKRGKVPCPSCAMELAKRMLIGNTPWANSITKI